MANDWLETDAAIAVAAISTVISWGISGFAIFRHLQNYTCPPQQKLIVRLLFICPLYSLCSCLSLRLTASALYFETVRDVYEAFIIYTFLALILEYAGGESACVSGMLVLGPVKRPVPFCCLAPKPRTARLLRECKQGTLQFVVVKPLVAAVSLVMMGVGKYYTTSYQTIMLTVYNISYTLALYYLLLFYLATREALGSYNPVRKFAAVKAVVFATYYQSMVLKVAPSMSAERAQQWSDFLLCLEVVAFAVVLWLAFPSSDYDAGPNAGLRTPSVLENARSVIAVKDVVDDAYHNFMPTYQDYVLQSTSDGDTPVKFRARTYLFGNLRLPSRGGGIGSGGDMAETKKNRKRGKRRRKSDIEEREGIEYLLTGECWGVQTQVALRAARDGGVSGKGLNQNGMFSVNGTADPSGFDLMAVNDNGPVSLRLTWEGRGGKGDGGEEKGEVELLGGKSLRGHAESLDSPSPLPASFRLMTESEAAEFSAALHAEDSGGPSNAISLTTDEEDEEDDGLSDSSSPPSTPPPASAALELAPHPSPLLPASPPAALLPPRILPPPAPRPSKPLLPVTSSATFITSRSHQPQVPLNSTVSPLYAGAVEDEEDPLVRLNSSANLIHSDTLPSFLDALGMGHLFSRFREFGVTSLEDAVSPFIVTDEDLVDDMGMSKDQVDAFRVAVARRAAALASSR